MEERRRIKSSPSSSGRIPQKEKVEGQAGVTLVAMVMVIDDLPPEMLTKILECVDTRSLFDCRLVNRKWLTISSRLLCPRPETEMEFKFQGEEGGFIQYFSPGGVKKTLQQFIQSFKGRKNCPIARFSFVDVSREGITKLFEHDHWLDFLANFNISTIKCLKLDFIAFDQFPDDYYDCIAQELYDELVLLYEHALNQVINKVRDLILFQIPQLEEFGLCLPQTYGAAADSAVPELRIKCKTLPNLKVLHFKDIMFEDYPEISRELLNAAVNLKRVQLHDRYHGNQIGPHILTSPTFEFLQSEGKLHLLREAEIQLTEEFLLTAKKYTNPSPAFKLTSVEISNRLNRSLNPNVNPSPSSVAEAKKLVQNLFESSKVSVRKLSMEPLGFLFLPGLQFLRLENLTELSLKSARGRSYPFFPNGVRNLNLFPAVRHLDFEFVIDCAGGFPTKESIPILPHVQNICVNDRSFSGAHVSVLALLCPNLTTLQIQRDGIRAPYSHLNRISGPFPWPTHDEYTFRAQKGLNFFEVGPLIWTHMKGLEHLEVDIDVDLKEHDSIALDSVFTGMSKETCQRLFDVEEARGLFKKWEIEVEIPESKLKAERELPSILDMKDLKTLTVNPYSVEKLRKEGNFFRNKLTWISQEYGFKLMPHLNTNGDWTG